MPPISSYERAALERRLHSLKAQLRALPHRDDLPSYVFAARMRNLVRDIRDLQGKLRDAPYPAAVMHRRYSGVPAPI
jgi:hypothetical protein